MPALRQSNQPEKDVLKYKNHLSEKIQHVMEIIETESKHAHMVLRLHKLVLNN